MNGRLIGMNSAMASMSGFGRTPNTPSGSIGIGFAIPIDHAVRIANELIATGTASHAWLGAQLTTEGDCYGARVIGVASGGPAAVGGLPNGALVTKVDDDQVIQNAGALYASVPSQVPGTRMALGFFDAVGEPRTVFVTLGSDHGRP